MTIRTFLGSFFGRPPLPLPQAIPAPSTNGHPSIIPGQPKTKDYRPSVNSYPGWMDGFGTGFNLGLVDEMKRDSQVKQCLRYLKAPLHLANFVYAGDPVQAKFADATLKRFWRKSLNLALLSMDYGYSVSEPVHKFGEGGKVEFNYLKPVHPRDARAWTAGGKLAYAKIRNMRGGGSGDVTLRPACGSRLSEVFWLTNEPTFNPYYGYSALTPAWVFWRWKTIPDGAIETVAKWAYKHSVGPTILRHPDTIFESGTPGDTTVTEAQDIMRELGEKAKAMAVIAMSSAETPSGKYKWDVQQWAKPEGTATALIEWLDWLDKAMRRGIGIPDEIIDHDGATGGYSRSQVAVQAYFTAAEMTLNHVLEAVWDQIVAPLLLLNFGSVKCKAEPKPLLPPEQPEPGKEGAPQGSGPPKPPSMTPEPKKPVAFSLGVSLPAGAALAPEHWGDIVTRLAPHVRIIGPTSSGKSTVAQAIASSTDGKIFVIDPVYEPGNWGGLPAVTVSPDGDYGPIEKAITGLLEEMKYRGAMLQGGNAHFERLTIIFDEVPDTVSELPDSAGLLIRRLAQRGRHENMHLIGIGQSDRVESWGIGGYGDVSESFVTIYLGSKAYEAMPELVGQERPAVLEWQGVRYPIDLSEILGLAERPIDASRLFKLPTSKPTTPQQLSLAQPSLYDRIRQGLQGQRGNMSQERMALAMERVADGMRLSMERERAAPVINVTNEIPRQAAPVVNVAAPNVTVTNEIPAQPPPIVNVAAPTVKITNQVPASKPADVKVINQVPKQDAPLIVQDSAALADVMEKVADALARQKPPIIPQPRSATKVVTKRDSDHLAVEIKETFEY